MNNSGCNSSIGININNINSIEFNLNSQNLQNPSNFPISNCNIASFQSDSSLVRPIPKKIALSRMIYQQFIDQCARQNQPGIPEISHVTDNCYSIQKMYHDSMVINSNNANPSNKFPHIQNTNIPCNDSSAWLNQYISINNGNQSVLNETQFYPHPHNMVSRNLPISTADGTSYICNHMNHQVSLRQNRLNPGPFVPKAEFEGTAILDNPKPINNPQYFPVPSLSDGLIENHFTMSLNQNLKFNYTNNKCNVKNENKSDKTKNNKCVKKQPPNRTEKFSKVMKRNKKPKDLIEYVDNVIQNSHTACTTPSDSSISPVSMVSCRSTVTPQTLYPSFSNLKSVIQNCPKTSEKEEITSKIFHQNSDPRTDNSLLNANKKKDDSNNLIQGLPLKKRIKWKVENEDDECSTESPMNDVIVTNGGNDTELSNINAGKIELHQNEDADKRKFMPFDPLNTFQKTFLPMEKHLVSSETESEEEVEGPSHDNGISQKDDNYLYFIDNNI